MKQHYRYNYLLLFLILSVIFSCKEKETQPDLDAVEAAMGKEEVVADTSKATAAETATEALIQECTAYIEEWEKLNASKAAYFKTVVLQKLCLTQSLQSRTRHFCWPWKNTCINL